MRILSNASNINMQRLRNGMLSDDEWMKVGDCLNRLSTCRIFIDDTPGLTPSRLRSRVRRLMMEQNGLDLIAIDYLGLMSSDRRQDNRQQEVSDISRGLKAIALELKVPVLACAQLGACQYPAPQQASAAQRSARFGQHRAGRRRGAVHSSRELLPERRTAG